MLFVKNFSSQFLKLMVAVRSLRVTMGFSSGDACSTAKSPTSPAVSSSSAMVSSYSFAIEVCWQELGSAVSEGAFSGSWIGVFVCQGLEAVGWLTSCGQDVVETSNQKLLFLGWLRRRVVKQLRRMALLSFCWSNSRIVQNWQLLWCFLVGVFCYGVSQ